METKPIKHQLSQIEVEFAKRLFHINHLMAYPLSDEMIVSWVRSIIELNPGITPDILKKIIDDMKRGLLPFDIKNGIRDLMRAIYFEMETPEQRIKRKEQEYERKDN